MKEGGGKQKIIIEFLFFLSLLSGMSSSWLTRKFPPSYGICGWLVGGGTSTWL